MHRRYRGIVIVLAIAAACALAWVALSSGRAPFPPPAPKPFAIAVTPGVEARYVNDGDGFSFQLPDGLLAQEATDGAGVTTVKLHDSAAAPYFQVVATPETGDPASFSTDTVAAIAPGTAVADAVPVPIAPGVNGIEFDSTSLTWAGPTRELWFAYKGHRYQISTKRINGDLLDFVWKSWMWR